MTGRPVRTEVSYHDVIMEAIQEMLLPRSGCTVRREVPDGKAASVAKGSSYSAILRTSAPAADLPTRAVDGVRRQSPL
jgi:hypothetical protein